MLFCVFVTLDDAVPKIQRPNNKDQKPTPKATMAATKLGGIALGADLLIVAISPAVRRDDAEVGPMLISKNASFSSDNLRAGVETRL